MVTLLVLRADGTNCEEETMHALTLAGAIPVLKHVNEIEHLDYAGIIIPGGFSYGDDVSAGKLFSLALKKIGLKEFIDTGKPVLGICNGFQALLKARFLDCNASLTFNDSGRFIDTWVRLKMHSSFMAKGLTKLHLPINHGEGRFVGDVSYEQIVLTYLDNPNGSAHDIAGISNARGNAIGIMPHPEKFVHEYQHPLWTRRLRKPLGLEIFKNVVLEAKKW